jgi:hypothetical protein
VVPLGCQDLGAGALSGTKKGDDLPEDDIREVTDAVAIKSSSS